MPAPAMASVPSGNTRRLLARDHATPEPTLLLTKVSGPCLVGVRPLAWCSRPRSSAASLDGPLMTSVLASNPLIQVVPGLMIWTIVCFGITFYVLKRFAFGRIQE